MYAGIVYGFAPTGNYNGDYSGNYYFASGNQINYYAGATLNTPLKQLTTGFAFDYAQNFGGGSSGGGSESHFDALVAGAYATFKATDKLSLNGRAEYVYGQDKSFNGETYNTGSADGFEVTGTVEYDLWANVMSRLEVRWDHLDSNYTPFGGYVDNRNSVGLYANVIYKF